MKTVIILAVLAIALLIIDRIMAGVAAEEAHRNLVDLLDMAGERKDSDEISDNLDI